MARRRGGGRCARVRRDGRSAAGGAVARGLSLRALAERLGVSPSLISQVETRPRQAVREHSLRDRDGARDLARRAAVRRRAASGAVVRPLPGSPADGGRTARGADGQLADRPPEDPVQRASDRAAIRLASGVTWERLTTASIPNVDFLYVTYEVGGASSPENEFQRHGGQEWGYVVRGKLRITVGFEEYLLGPGDAIALDSGTPHRLFNAGDEPVHGVWFVQGRRPAEVASATTSSRPSANQPPVHSH